MCFCHSRKTQMTYCHVLVWQHMWTCGHISCGRTVSCTIHVCRLSFWSGEWQSADCLSYLSPSGTRWKKQKQTKTKTNNIFLHVFVINHIGLQCCQMYDNWTFSIWQHCRALSHRYMHDTWRDILMSCFDMADISMLSSWSLLGFWIYYSYPSPVI